MVKPSSHVPRAWVAAGQGCQRSCWSADLGQLACQAQLLRARREIATANTAGASPGRFVSRRVSWVSGSGEVGSCEAGSRRSPIADDQDEAATLAGELR
jgi:hypothetical protein